MYCTLYFSTTERRSRLKIYFLFAKLMAWLCSATINTTLHSCSCPQAALFQYCHQKDDYITWKPAQLNNPVRSGGLFRAICSEAMKCYIQLASACLIQRNEMSCSWWDSRVLFPDKIFVVVEQAEASVYKDRALLHCWTATKRGVEKAETGADRCKRAEALYQRTKC